MAFLLSLRPVNPIQESEGISDEMVVRRILANVGLVPPPDVVLSSVAPPAPGSRSAGPAAAADHSADYDKHVGSNDTKDADDGHKEEKEGDGKDRLAAVAAAAAAAEVSESEHDLLDLSTVMESPVSHRQTFHSSSSAGVQDITTTAGAAEEQQGVGHEKEGVQNPRPPAVQMSVSMDQPSSKTPRPVPHRSASESVMSAGNKAGSLSGAPASGGGDDDFTGEEILSALRTMEVGVHVGWGGVFLVDVS